VTKKLELRLCHRGRGHWVASVRSGGKLRRRTSFKQPDLKEATLSAFLWVCSMERERTGNPDVVDAALFNL
jgi:hypothetical protein